TRAQTIERYATELRKTLAVLFEPGQVFEVRLIDAPKGTIPEHWKAKATVAGFFNDHDLAAVTVARIALEKRPPAIYLTLNPVKTAALAKAKNRLIVGDNLTGDEHITHRRWLFLDFDPDRNGVKGISSTNEEQ